MAYNAAGNIKAKYTHGLSIDEPLAVKKSDDIYYYHADGLGSIIALTDATGAVVETYSYDSFGNMTKTGDIRQPFTYTAREFDSETGLYYYRARYYDAKAGRFLQRDPIGFEGGDVNLYAYVGNDPVNFIDPSGETVTKAPSMTSALPLPAVMRGLECMSKCLKGTITIGSGWRDKEHNDKVCGKKKSYHLFGMASDIYTPPSETKLREAAKECGFFVLSTKYKWGIHVDIRSGNPKGEPDECECQKIREGR